MRLLLGLFFFSVLLTAGTSMQCERCFAVNAYCSATKVECPPKSEVCMSVEFKSNDNTAQVSLKDCNLKNECKLYEDFIGKKSPKIIPGAPKGIVITEAICSKAPPSFASFFPAVLGLLLVKLLF